MNNAARRHFELGQERLKALDYFKAIEHFRSALVEDPGLIVASAGLATCLSRIGKDQEAYDLLQPLFDAGARDAALLTDFARLAPSRGRSKEVIMKLREVLADGTQEGDTRAALLYSLGRLLDLEGDYDDAFAAFEAAGRIKPHQFDCAGQQMGIDACMTAFDSELFARPFEPPSLSETPIFIVGMPRSGTTLVEQILASHPQVHGGGELDYLPALASQLYRLLGTPDPFPQCIKKVDGITLKRIADTYLLHTANLAPAVSTRITDKLPANFILVGFIALLFPNARIIHVRRNPLDNCISCFVENFLSGNHFSYDLTDLGCYYREYSRLMQHWRSVLPGRMFEIEYERLVQEPEATTRALVQHCGLDWDERCLSSHDNTRIVATASYQQVRSPVYTRSVGRWRNYDRHLGPLYAALGKARADYGA
jgi:hypothetical protein